MVLISKLGQIKKGSVLRSSELHLRRGFSYLWYMGTKELIREIERLPISKRMLVIERALKSIRQSELKGRIEKAVDTLMDDYQGNKELTAFTSIDFERFYETR